MASANNKYRAEITFEEGDLNIGYEFFKNNETIVWQEMTVEEKECFCNTMYEGAKFFMRCLADEKMREDE